MKNLKICVVGCGRMANNHLNQILKLVPREQVAVCDLDIYKARLISEVWDVAHVYDRLDEAIREFAADIYHIVTPPHVHVPVAIQCLEAGGHVYVEKPLCLDEADAEKLLGVAKKHGRLLCVGHQRAFEGQFEQLKGYVTSGKYGKLLHLAGYDSAPFLQMEDMGLGNSWSSGLSGGMFTDLLPHMLSMFVELMPDLAMKHSHVARDGKDRPAEMYVSYAQEHDLGFASIHYSFSTDVIQNYVRAEFEHGVVFMDVRNRLMVVIAKTGLPGLIERVWFNVSHALQLGWHATWSVPRFLTGRADPYEGVGKLTAAFYEAVAQHQASPLSEKHMADVVRLTSEAVRVGFPEPPKSRDPENPMPLDSGNGENPTILITGGTGFIGKHLVTRLLAEGARIRLVTRRQLARDTFTPAEGGRLQLAVGQITDAAFMARCMEGIETVYHLAAATRGDMVANVEATCRGTANLLKALEGGGVKKLVYLSTVAIYDQGGFPSRGEVDEDFSLEPEPLKRGAYTYAKLKAEEDVLAFIENNEVAVDIIRPGLVWGPGKPQLLLETNIKLGKRWRLIFGRRKKKLPLIYVENLVDALILSGNKAEAAPGPMNIADNDVLDQGKYLAEVSRITGRKLSALFLPLGPMILVGKVAEWFFRVLFGRKMAVSYKLKSKLSSAEYSTKRIQAALGWETRVPFREALSRDLSENPDYF